MTNLFAQVFDVTVATHLRRTPLWHRGEAGSRGKRDLVVKTIVSILCLNETIPLSLLQ